MRHVSGTCTKSACSLHNTSFPTGPRYQHYSTIVLKCADKESERCPSSVDGRYDQLVCFYLHTAVACRLDVVRKATGTHNCSSSLNSAFKIIKRFSFSSPLYYMRFFLSQLKYYWIITYLLTSLLTAWSGVLLENLTGFHLAKKFLAFY